jgi:Anti-sigma factor NepR
LRFCGRGVVRREGFLDLSKSRDDNRSGRPQRAPKDVGAALKKAYERTLREEIPSDLLDLLGKLD